jgi:hypothetical protein
MQRLLEFGEQYQITVRLAYYPPIIANITQLNGVGVF